MRMSSFTINHVALTRSSWRNIAVNRVVQNCFLQLSAFKRQKGVCGNVGDAFYCL